MCYRDYYCIYVIVCIIAVLCMKKYMIIQYVHVYYVKRDRLEYTQIQKTYDILTRFFANSSFTTCFPASGSVTFVMM